MTTAEPDTPGVSWLTDWDAALVAARTERKVVLIDVWKDP